MTISFGVALCVAYVLGLLLSPSLGTFPLGHWALPGGCFGGLGLLGWAAIAPRRWHLGLGRRQWAALAGVMVAATLYMAVRAPAPGAQDISHYVARAQAIAPTHVVVGTVMDEPSLNRDLKGRFGVAVRQLQVRDATGAVTFQIPVRGRVYVTAPLLQVTGLHRGQSILAQGRLYLPQAAMNPNGFDFQAFLTQRGIFTGLAAESLRFPEAPPWGLWRLRQRIVKALVRGLGSPLGQLVSAMCLGRRAVDLPTPIQDLFARVGLAHTVAASGFHISLLLGTVLALVRSRSVRLQVAVGAAVLIGYVALTGLQVSVLRAALMGAATLVGLLSDRRVMPRGALIAVVTLMLLINPNWLWDLGFQLSVTATWGLIVTASAITHRLSWLPVTVASLIAVPLAATLWTLPLSLYHFNVLSGLSVVLNAITTPLVSMITLGGIGSSVLALLSPTVGTLAAKLLYLPTQGLLWLAETSSTLPGSAIAIGQITLSQLIALYAILLVSLLKLRWTALKPVLGALFLALILMPLGWQLLTQDQVTVLAAGDELIWVRQDHGHTTLVNSGDEKTAFYTVAPFLKQAGINQVETAIALPFTEDYIAGWQTLLWQTPTADLYRQDVDFPGLAAIDHTHLLTPGQSQPLHHMTAQLLGTQHPILRLTTGAQSWLLLPPLSLELQDYLANAGSGLASSVLVWPGGEISAKLLAVVQPQTAIAYGQGSESVERQLQQAHIQTYVTQRDGAVTWHPHRGFHGFLTTKHRNVMPWG